MENDLDKQVPKDKAPVNYDDKIVGQKALIDRLNEDQSKNPSPGLALEIKRKTDALRHLENLAKDDPKGRAKRAAEAARHSALSKAYA